MDLELYTILPLYTKAEKKDRFNLSLKGFPNMRVQKGAYFFMEKNYFFPNTAPGFYSSDSGRYVFFAKNDILYIGVKPIKQDDEN